MKTSVTRLRTTGDRRHASGALVAEESLIGEHEAGTWLGDFIRADWRELAYQVALHLHGAVQIIDGPLPEIVEGAVEVFRHSFSVPIFERARFRAS